MTLCLFLALGAGTTAAWSAQPAPLAECPDGAAGVRLQFSIDHIRDGAGDIVITVYGDRAEDFLAKGKKLLKVRVPARQGMVTGCLLLPHPGTYALAIYHDEDKDGKFTRNFVGLPAEGYAFSNNPVQLIVPPAFASVAFQARPSGERIRMDMQYP